MNVEDFREMYVAELQELRSVEDQLVQALPQMAEKAKSAELKQAIESHLDETKSQRDRLDRLLQNHKAGTREHKDQSMQAIIHEADKWAGMVQDADLRDAGLIASAQRVEHYEMAVYGTLTAWARQLGHDEDARVLHEILEEEQKADQKLTALGKQQVNPEAAQH